MKNKIQDRKSYSKTITNYYLNPILLVNDFSGIKATEQNKTKRELLKIDMKMELKFFQKKRS